MPQTHAERQKNIEKKSVTEILKRNNGRKRIKKEERKRKSSIKLVSQKDRVRKQRTRQNAAKKLLASDTSAYKSICSHGKAVKEAQSVLSKSSHK